MVLCQARADSNGDGTIAAQVGHHGHMGGDEMRPYLVMGRGAGEPIDDYVGHDPTGRYVLLVRQRRLQLLDTWRAQTDDLGVPDPHREKDRSPFLGHYAGDFSRSGKHLVTAEEGVSRTLLTVLAGPKTLAVRYRAFGKRRLAGQYLAIWRGDGRRLFRPPAEGIESIELVDDRLLVIDGQGTLRIFLP